MTWLGGVLGIKEHAGWYKVTAADFVSNYGQALVKRHGTVGKVCEVALPQHKWEADKFASGENVKHDLKAERECILSSLLLFLYLSLYLFLSFLLFLFSFIIW
jgi:hypothetical protein